MCMSQWMADFYYFILCVWMFCLHVSLCTMYGSWGARRGPKNELDPLKRVIDSCKLLCVFWGLNLSSLGERPAPLTAEPLANRCITS